MVIITQQFVLNIEFNSKYNSNNKSAADYFRLKKKKQLLLWTCELKGHCGEKMSVHPSAVRQSPSSFCALGESSDQPRCARLKQWRHQCFPCICIPSALCENLYWLHCWRHRKHPSHQDQRWSAQDWFTFFSSSSQTERKAFLEHPVWNPYSDF